MGPVSQPGGSVSSPKTNSLATWDNGDAAVGKLVRPLVPGVTGVALDPAPGDRVPGQLGLQQPPQVGVLDRLLGGGDPAVPLPAGQPPRDPVHHVRGARRRAGGTSGARAVAVSDPASDGAGEDLARADAVDMWTDGACKGNPGPGGWGAWLHL